MSTPSQPAPARKPLDDFSKKCYYIRRQYDCQHQTGSRNPRVVHVEGCQHRSASKARCLNMASKPREVMMPGMCSKCRPVGLGVGGKLAPFERLILRKESEERAQEMAEKHEQSDRGGGPLAAIKANGAVDESEAGARSCDKYQKNKTKLTILSTAARSIATDSATMMDGDGQLFKRNPSPTAPSTESAGDLLNHTDKWQDATEDTGLESLSDGEVVEATFWRDEEDWVYVS